MTKKILVIDDDPLIIKTLKRYLRSVGYNIETAQSGREALEKAGKEDFDLIISDIRMPGMDGIETLKRIRESGCQHSKEKAPAIVITGYAGNDDVYRKSGELGIVECIYKPFELEEFIVAIKKNLKIDDAQSSTVRDIQADYKLLDENFISLTKEIDDYLQALKRKFDDFDKQNRDERNQIAFIEKHRKEDFGKLDNYFEKVWAIIKNLNKDKYIVYQNYFQHKLHSFREGKLEINNHIFNKPLGYPGDFMMMNYIYNYNGTKNYLGKSTFEKFISNYTCNVPISCSNIKRKEFLKEKIAETLENNEKVKILSIACGPAREMTELIREGKINKPTDFKCLDFEKRALDYIENEIKNIEKAQKELLSIEYICRDITSIIRDKALKDRLKEQDLVYAFGIFDYLSERMGSRLIKELFQLVKKGGKLIICNISLEHSSHRGYYEFLGEWNMIHRTEDEMLGWAKELEGLGKAAFEHPAGGDNYLFMVLEKS